MLKPLVKRGLFFSIEEGVLPPKMRTLDFGGISPPRNQLTTKTRFWCRERPANPYRVSWSSGNQNQEKRKKSTLGLNISPPPPNDPPLRTLRFVHVGWGRRHNHPCQVSSQSVQQFRLPRGSKFTISHRLGEWLLQHYYALTCYTVIVAQTKICKYDWSISCHVPCDEICCYHETTRTSAAGNNTHFNSHLPGQPG